MLSGHDKFAGLHNRVNTLGKEVDGLLESAENYIKRTLYTSQKQQELEQAKERVLQVKELERKTTFILEIYAKIQDNIDKAQFHTAVLLFKFVEEKGLIKSMGMQEFEKIHTVLKTRTQAQLNE